MKKIDEKIDMYLNEGDYSSFADETKTYLDRQVKLWQNSSHPDETKKAILMFIKQMKKDLDFGKG
jgi:hypothetical protein